MRRMGWAAMLAAALALASAGAEAKTLVYCSEASPEGFDPALYTAGTTFDAASRPIYNRLLEFKHGSTELEPGLATSWDISPDGTVYTFHLREGVAFQTAEFFTPTRTLSADDVVFSFERQLKSDNPWHGYVTGGGWEYAESMGFPKLVKSVEKVDDLTVRFTLTHPEAPFLADLAMDFASILSKEYADSLVAAGAMAQMNEKPLGTGPFSFVDYRPDSVIRYAANPTYWGGRQKIDALVFAITPDAAVRAQKLQAGECQITLAPNAADVEMLQRNPALRVLQTEGLNVAYLAYNTLQKPFDDVRVRRALNMAIDKKAIVDSVFQGAATIAKNPIPPTMWGYNDDIVDDPYDPDSARDLLAEAGAKDLSMKIWAMPVARPYMLNARRTAEILQADFAKVGVTAEIVTYDWAQYLEKSKARDRDGAVIMGWTGDNGDPDNFLHTLLGCDGLGGNNRAQWCNEGFDKLVTEAKQVAGQDERAMLYRQAQAIFKDQAPWATLDHSIVFMPMSVKVQGFVQDPLGYHRFDGVGLDD